MNRQEKIESILRGDLVIKNDMQGDVRCLEVLNSFDKSELWTGKNDFYGIDENGKFSMLWEFELNNRPQILMSELVVDEKIVLENFKILKQCIMDGHCGVKEVDNGYGRGSWDKEDFTKEELSTIADDIIINYKESLQAHPSEPKEVFTVDSKKLDELYKEWSGVSHLDNSGKPIHDSSECTDFANYVIKYFKI